MTKKDGHKIVIIGCGNVAWHIAKHCATLENVSVLVYNHRPNPVLNEFKNQMHCTVYDSLNEIVPDANYYFICVSDQNIAAVSKFIHCEKSDAVILHTSGSCELKEIKTKHKNRGVFYPLQTFSKKDQINWGEIPLLLEASNTITQALIKRLAKQFSNVHLFLKYKQRLKFHLAAVMVNNFTNALYVEASKLVTNKQTDFEILKPLIKQTTAKLEKLNPLAAQTGPAKRKDTTVLKKHRALLVEDKSLIKIYTEISKRIIKQQLDA